MKHQSISVSVRLSNYTAMIRVRAQLGILLLYFSKSQSDENFCHHFH